MIEYYIIVTKTNWQVYFMDWSKSRVAAALSAIRLYRSNSSSFCALNLSTRSSLKFTSFDGSAGKADSWLICNKNGSHIKLDSKGFWLNWTQILLVWDRNSVSVSGTKTKVQFRYRFRSRNFFSETETFFSNFSHFSPLLWGNISFYKLQNKPRS